MFKNTCTDIEFALREGGAQGTRFEFECYDTAHRYNLAHFVERGLAKPPLFTQTVFGILGGIGSHPDDVAHMKRTADRPFGADYLWSVLGAGRLARSNADQVRRVRRGLEALGLEIATPDDARAMLHLKGPRAVRF